MSHRTTWDRLLKLAKYLEAQPRGYKVFADEVLHSSRSIMADILSETFKNHKAWSVYCDGDSSLENFLGIDSMELEHLLCPGEQDVGEYGGKPLGKGATAKQVAHNIRVFVARDIKNPAESFA